MKKDYVALNNEILAEWKKQRPDYDFSDDGIMYRGDFEVLSEKCFARKPSGTESSDWEDSMRIAILTKDQNAGGEGSWDTCSETGRERMEKAAIQRVFFRNLMYCLHALTSVKPDHVPQLPSTEEMLRTYDSTPHARINVKKNAGNSKLENRILKEYLEKDQGFIMKQIENLEPRIIVCCGYSGNIKGTGNMILNFLNEHGYTFEQQTNEGWIYYDRARNVVAINTYHFAYPGRKVAKTTPDQLYMQIRDDYHTFLRNKPEFLAE